MKIAIPIAVFAVITSAGIELYRSPFLQIHTVEVRNARYVSPDTVIETSGLIGQNIFTPGLQRTEEKLQSIPMVKSAVIHRQLPNTVDIVIQEREPWGTWEVAGGRYVIDRDGVVLDRGLPQEGAPIVMQMEGGSSLPVGGRVDPDSLQLIRQLQEQLPGIVPASRAHVVAYEFRNKDGLTVVLRGGLRVTFGDSHDLEFKLGALRALLAKAPDTSFVDLRFGDRIVFQAPERTTRP